MNTTDMLITLITSIIENMTLLGVMFYLTHVCGNPCLMELTYCSQLYVHSGLRNRSFPQRPDL